LDIQYNRSEGYRTVIVPNATTVEVTGDNESPNETPSTAKLYLNDHKYIETTVIFMPNIWTLMPNNIEYQKIVDRYKNFIDDPNYIPPDFLNTSTTKNSKPNGQVPNDLQDKHTSFQSGSNTSEPKALNNIYLSNTYSFMSVF
jgi:hypothetical protein